MPANHGFAQDLRQGRASGATRSQRLTARRAGERQPITRPTLVPRFAAVGTSGRSHHPKDHRTSNLSGPGEVSPYELMAPPPTTGARLNHDPSNSLEGIMNVRSRRHALGQALTLGIVFGVPVLLLAAFALSAHITLTPAK